MTVEVRKLQELTLESLPEGVEVLRLDNDGVILREMKILTGNGGYTVKSLNEGVGTCGNLRHYSNCYCGR